jgi:hypothetical protein
MLAAPAACTFKIGTDAISQVLKEFWPDIKHK